MTPLCTRVQPPLAHVCTRVQMNLFSQVKACADMLHTPPPCMCVCALLPLYGSAHMHTLHTGWAGRIQ